MNERELTASVFAPYWQFRCRQEEAITPGEQLALIEKLEAECKAGKVPVSPTNTLTLPPTSPVVQSLAQGRPIALGGEESQEKRPRVSRRTALLVLAGALLVLVAGFAFIFISLTAEAEPQPETIPTVVLETETAGTTVADLISDFIGDDEENAPPSPTPLPTSTPLPTAAPVATLPPPPRRVADAAHEPTSLEVAGHVYPLSVATAGDEWRPREPQWLAGTELRRVVAIPYDADLLNALLGTYDVMRLRLRSGEVIAYRLSDIRRVNRSQTEVFSSLSPSMAVVMYEESDDPQRWVLVGEAMQAETELYTAALRPTPAASSQAVQLVESPVTVAGIRLAIEPCTQIRQLEGRPPVAQGQIFVVCQVALSGVNGQGVVSRSASETTAVAVDLYLSEFEWLQDTAWQPQTVVLSQFQDENKLILRLAGIVRQAEGYPVLAWDRAQIRHLLPLVVMPIEGGDA